MNTEVRSQEIAKSPVFPLAVRSATKVATELKPKSRSAGAKKKYSAAKKAGPKRKAAPKSASLAKSKPSRKKLEFITSIVAGEIAIEPVVAANPSAAIEPVVVAESAPSPVCEPLVCEALPDPAEAEVADEIFEPVPVAENTAQIEAMTPVEHSLVAESNLDDMELAADSVTLGSDDGLVLDNPVLQAAKENPLQPVVSFLRSVALFLAEKFSWAQRKFKSHQVRKRLRVCETVSLGEKRFVAVIQVDGEQFLVGGSSSSVSTLAHLEPAREFSDVFQRHCQQDMSQA